MDRRKLTDGRFVDFERVRQTWKEETDWNGNNHVSRATGSQWNHEMLILTASRCWVIWAWSQWQGSLDTYTMINAAAAAQWLVLNGLDAPDDLAVETAALDIDASC